MHLNLKIKEPPSQLGHNTHNGLLCFPTASDALDQLEPDVPVFVLYPDIVTKKVTKFVKGFKGKTLFAVKANPHPYMLNLIWNAGVRHFDVASLQEVELIRTLFPSAEIYFMHPVKSRRAIDQSYNLGVRNFAIDSISEIEKIKKLLGDVSNIGIFVRLAVKSGTSAYDLSGKFGANKKEAIALLKAAKEGFKSVGVTFHVGSQCMNPKDYSKAIKKAADYLKEANVEPDAIDIGGGFPVPYPGMDPLPLSQYFAEIEKTIDKLGFSNITLMAEPGRALVAEGGSTLARVEMRRGRDLYLNEGVFGSLFDAGGLAWRFPVRMIPHDGREISKKTKNFRFFGPTCDSLDQMKGPFTLPECIEDGDWVEIGVLGAYGQTMASFFNGFHSEITIGLESEPIPISSYK